MKKMIVGFLAFASISSVAAPKGADCYFSYANKRLDQKVGQAIGGLGIGYFWQSGVARTTEIITESIALRRHDEEFYLHEIKDGAFGRRLERIIEERKINRLHTMKDYLLENGEITNRNEEENLTATANIIVRALDSGLLCRYGLQGPLDISEILSLNSK